MVGKGKKKPETELGTDERKKGVCLKEMTLYFSQKEEKRDILGLKGGPTKQEGLVGGEADRSTSREGEGCRKCATGDTPRAY